MEALLSPGLRQPGKKNCIHRRREILIFQQPVHPAQSPLISFRYQIVKRVTNETQLNDHQIPTSLFQVPQIQRFQCEIGEEEQRVS